MARIRTIKPDAFKSESLSSVSILARWTFAGLWTYLDDKGRGRADVRLLKAELFPLDDRTTASDVDGAMSELIDAGCIHTYMSGGKVYVHCPEFLRHQKINRPTPATSPACSCESHDPLNDHSNEPAHVLLSEEYAIDTEVARTKLAAMGVALEQLTPDQERYLSTWRP